MPTRTSPGACLRFVVLSGVVAGLATLGEAEVNEVGIFVATSRIPLSSTVTDPESGLTAVLDLEQNTGVGLSYSRFWTDKLATEIAVQQADSDVRARIGAGGLGVELGIGTLRVTALSAILQWHPRRDAAVSPWVGAGIVGLDGELDVPRSITELADLEDTHLGQVASWIANTGISVRLTRQLRLAIDGRYTRYKPDSPTAVIQDGRAIHPLLVGVGMRMRF